MPSSKSKTKPQHNWAFSALGTQWWIGIYQPITDADFAALQQSVEQRIDTYDSVYSRFRADSFVTKLSHKAGTYKLPSDAAPMLDFYKQLYDATDGQVTPLIGGLMSDAGYDADYSLQPGVLRPVPSWDEVLTVTNTSLSIAQPVMLDFGAAGKGYVIDILSNLLQAHGVTSYCIDGSGDMRAAGLPQPLQVGLEDPSDTSMAIGIVELIARSLCSSSPARRRWAGMHHIMDPTTKAPTYNVASTWVLADSCMCADGLATALFFTPPEQLQHIAAFEYLLLDADNRVHMSDNFPVTLFTSDESAL